VGLKQLFSGYAYVAMSNKRQMLSTIIDQITANGRLKNDRQKSRKAKRRCRATETIQARTSFLSFVT